MRWRLGRTIVLSALGVLLVVASLLILLLRASPLEGKIVMATGNTTYHDLADTYRADLEANGVSLELRDTTEGFATLQALVDDKTGVNAGFVKDRKSTRLNSSH